MRKIKKIFAASTMAAMLMLPTYGAMASGVKKEIYEKESAYKMDHWLRNALHDVTCIMEKDAYKL